MCLIIFIFIGGAWSRYNALLQLNANLQHVGLQIELGFLMVGHTHEDIDALFGNIGKWLKKNNALTVTGK